VHEAGLLTVTNSVIDNNEMYGLYSNGTGLTISNTVLQRSGAQGLNLAAGAGSIQYSTFMSNSIGIQFNGTISPVIQQNIFENNSSWGLYNSAAFTIDATNNWWGSPSGPGSPAPRDQVGGAVTYNPWLTARPW